jgi:polyhydroxyalkanoate synthesis repressor PhaR
MRPKTIKKYSNRRLYDPEASRYITLDELAAQIRAGQEVRVVDAKTGAELTQATLAQIILESRGAAKLLPVPLLERLIRLGDASLAEFIGRYVSWALDVYLRTRKSAEAVRRVNPLAFLPFGAADALASLWSRAHLPWTPADEVEWTPPPPEPALAREADEEAELLPEPATRTELSQLRREVEELKSLLRSMLPRRKGGAGEPPSS